MIVTINDKIIDTDTYEEPNFNVEDIVYNFYEELDFNEKLYGLCSFDIEWDDYRKWVVLSDGPSADSFYEDLIYFAEDYMSRKLTMREALDLIHYLNDDWDHIIEENRQDLEERYIENHFE